MEELRWIWELVRDWVPTLIVMLGGILLVSAARYVLLRRFEPPTGQGRTVRQLMVASLAAIVIVVFILSLPIAESVRGQLLSLLGLLVTAAVALSSTTLLGNAMAGLMLRALRNFRPGDFIVVNEHRGRVSDRGWLRTEIQTERRNLTTFPNLYLVTNPMTVIRSSGCFIAADVSLGYDVPRDEVETCLTEATKKAGLDDPFVFVTNLGDFSITYQAAGFLEDVKYLISAESKLRACMLDALHEAGIEIVSPTFMNQRQLDPAKVFIPKAALRKLGPTVARIRPEELMFDKAEEAESNARVEDQLKRVVEQMEAIKKSEEAESPEAETKLETLEQMKEALEVRVKELEERKKTGDES